MKRRKAFKYRLNVPTGKQSKLFEFSGCCRFVWNKCWAFNMTRLKTQQKILWYQECDFWVKLWKRSDDYGFLKNCHSQILQQR